MNTHIALTHLHPHPYMWVRYQIFNQAKDCVQL